jgi:hypothetical protein
MVSPKLEEYIEFIEYNYLYEKYFISKLILPSNIQVARYLLILMEKLFGIAFILGIYMQFL